MSIWLRTFVLWWFFAMPSLAQATQPPGSGLISRPITAIGFFVDGGSTALNLKGTGLIPGAGGKANVKATPGITTIQVEVQGLTPPGRLGPDFLTYIVWAVSQEGRAANLGALLPDAHGRGRLNGKTHLPTFALLVTAEPYSVVRQPSEILILENDLRKETKGKLVTISDYKLVRRSQYENTANPPSSMNLKQIPLEMYEARNAVQIARCQAADQYASVMFSKAQMHLKTAERSLGRKASRKDIISEALQALQFAEDARALAVERQDQERVARQEAEAAAAGRVEAEAKAAREGVEATQRADEEASRQAELATARQARLKAEAAARQAQLRAEASIAEARAQAESDRLKVQEDAIRADAERHRRSAIALRAELLEQFNRILATRDTQRGLVITMTDGLFVTGRNNLKPGAREQLAKLIGIVLAHPDLQLSIEGHSDETSRDGLNQRLWKQRADSVRAYLIAQGIEERRVSATGFEKTAPLNGTETAARRQQNRRVELIVSGDVIGVALAP